MKKAKLLGLSLLLFTSLSAVAKDPKQADIKISDPRDFRKVTPDYERSTEEIESIDIYKKLLELKKNPESSYNTRDEMNLTKQEEAIEKILDEQRVKEETLEKDLKTIESTMPNIYSQALSVVTSWFSSGGSSSEQKYSKEDLKKAQDAVSNIKKQIESQEKGLEDVSKEINDMISDKDKLTTALPTLVKQDKGDSANAIKTFKAKKEKLKAADPMSKKLKAAKKGDVSNTMAMAILAERFLIKLAALDQLYDTLKQKISVFKAKVAEDQGILTMMAADPELKQGAAGWGEKIKNRLVTFALYKNREGIQNKQQTEYNFRKGLNEIKTILHDEIKQYEEVIKSFQEYSRTLPKKIEEFKEKKSAFFKTHYDVINKAITTANRNVVETLATKIVGKNIDPKDILLDKNLVTELEEKQKTMVWNDHPDIVRLRNLAASYERQRFYLDQAANVSPSSKEELDEARRRSEEAMNVTADAASTPAQQQKSIDELLEALVSLTEITKASSQEILDPIIEKYVKGFFGASIVQSLAKNNAPALIDRLIGLFLGQIAASMDKGADYSNKSPQLRLLAIIGKINDLNHKLSQPSDENNKTLLEEKKALVSEGKKLKMVVDCLRTSLDSKHREKRCSEALQILKGSAASDEDKKLEESLQQELKDLQKEIKANTKPLTTATNKAQRLQETESAIMGALVTILDDSTQVREEVILQKIKPLTTLKDDDYRDFVKAAPEQVAKRVVPILNGILSAKLKSAIKGFETDPTKLAYHDKRIVDLLTARITAKEGTSDYERLSREIKQAFEHVMAVREKYKKKIGELGNFEKSKKGILAKIGLGTETETSKRQHRRAVEGAKQAGQDLLGESEKYKAGIKEQSAH